MVVVRIKSAFVSNVRRVFGDDGNEVVALDGVTWDFRDGTFTAIMGPSGSGKTTLLQAVAGLNKPTSGQVGIGGTRIDQMPERELAVIRRESVGFVFQEFNLLPALTAHENITLPLRLAGKPLDREWFDQICTRAGITDRLDHLPRQLSGGQQQRVALCRALVNKPRLLCADEPTGALDSESSRQIMSLLREAVDEFGSTLVLVTHDPIAAAYSDQVLFLVDGRITDRVEQPNAQKIGETMTTLVGGT